MDGWNVLRSGPLVADGGMGTSLVARGVATGACFEALNVEEPDLVSEVHGEFVKAGAQVVWTNTFAANRFKLTRHGLAARIAELNRAGVALAREAGVAVAGAVGPLGVHLAPYGRVRPDEAYEAYAEQIAALAEAGADLIVVETQSALREAEQALAAARAVTDLPVVVTATFTRDDRTLLGSTPEHVANRLVELGADGIGANCSQGPAQVLRLVERMCRAAPDVPVVARPNAGGPQQVGGRLLYPATPAYFGEHAQELVAAGATILGGCCGTDPSHISAIAEGLRSGARATAVAEREPPAQPVASAELPEPSGLEAKLAGGRFVVTVEMDPPRSSSAAPLLAAAESLADAGADAISVADSPMASMRMSPWAACRLVVERIGIDTVLHFPTRGRNILRIQGDLLAAHALGVRNVFVCMGDPTSVGDYPEAASNFDVAPTGLIALITQNMNRGRDQSGASIGDATNFTVGCALNLDAPDFDRECRLLRRKIASGADFALTQPVYDAAVVDRFRAAYEARHGELTLPLLVGVLPPVSARHAEFLHNEVPGITIPDDVRDRLRRAGDDASREGARSATAITAALAERADGVYLMPPFNRYDIAAEIVDAVRALR